MIDTILFVFEPEKKAIKIAKNMLDEKNIKVKQIVNLSKNFQLDTDLPQKHLVEYAFDAKREYREISCKWVQDIAKIKLQNGSTLFDAITHNGISLWWFVELGLQEKSFRIIRFIETIIFVLEHEKVENVVIIGEWEEEWTKSILYDICQIKKRKVIDLKIKIEKDLEIYPDKEIRIIGKIQSKKRKLIKKLLIIFSSPFVGLFFAYIAKQNKENKKIRIKDIVKHWVNSPIQLSLIQICSYIASVFGVRNELNDFYGKKIVDPYHKYGVLILRYYHDIKGKVKGNKKGPRISKKDILLLCETDAIKQRIFLNNCSKTNYNPYIENIPNLILKESIQRKLDITCLYYASGRRKIPIIMNKQPIKIEDFFKEKHDLCSKQIKEKIKLFIEKLQYDKKFFSEVNYKGINLEKYFVKEICNGYENSLGAVYNMDVCSDILKESDPSVVILNNYEGVFRPIVAACVLNNIYSIGIQQALGPYVHALNKFEYGLRNIKNSNKTGFPIPEKICLWGNIHKEKFLKYGFTEKNLIVSGYSRLDTFVNEKTRLDRNKIKQKLGLNVNSKIIMYTGTFHPPGVFVTLEDNYIKTLEELVKITDSFENTYVLIKPWSGDKINDIMNFIKKYGNSKTVFVHPSTDVHNVELLAITDIVIGSYSSIFAESIAMDCENIFLNYPEAQFYDELSHIELIEKLVHTVKSPSEIFDNVKKLLNTKNQKIIESEFKEVFGPLDGRSSERISKTIIDLVQKNKKRD